MAQKEFELKPQLLKRYSFSFLMETVNSTEIFKNAKCCQRRSKSF